MHSLDLKKNDHTWIVLSPWDTLNFVLYEAPNWFIVLNTPTLCFFFSTFVLNPPNCIFAHILLK